ncbi:hypothetical protein NL676_036404 [Syzygium grande]|nr:hypothetical protein NL676_036404 [Syzygium grande]
MVSGTVGHVAGLAFAARRGALASLIKERTIGEHEGGEGGRGRGRRGFLPAPLSISTGFRATDTCRDPIRWTRLSPGPAIWGWGPHQREVGPRRWKRGIFVDVVAGGSGSGDEWKARRRAGAGHKEAGDYLHQNGAGVRQWRREKEERKGAGERGGRGPAQYCCSVAYCGLHQLPGSFFLFFTFPFLEWAGGQGDSFKYQAGRTGSLGDPLMVGEGILLTRKWFKVKPALQNEVRIVTAIDEGSSLRIRGCVPFIDKVKALFWQSSKLKRETEKEKEYRLGLIGGCKRLNPLTCGMSLASLSWLPKAQARTLKCRPLPRKQNCAGALGSRSAPPQCERGLLASILLQTTHNKPLPLVLGLEDPIKKQPRETALPTLRPEILPRYVGIAVVIKTLLARWAKGGDTMVDGILKLFGTKKGTFRYRNLGREEGEMVRAFGLPLQIPASRPSTLEMNSWSEQLAGRASIRTRAVETRRI